MEADVEQGRLATLHELVRHSLERADDVLGGLRASEDRRVESCLTVIQDAGVLAANALVGDDSRRLRKLINIFRLLNAGAERMPDSVRTIEVRGDHQFLPLQVIPLFDLGEVPPIRSSDDVMRVCSRFLGFSMALKYDLESTPLEAPPVEGPVIVQFLHYGKQVKVRNWMLKSRTELALPATRVEAQYLTGSSPGLAVEGPWPTSPAIHPNDAKKHLLKILADPRLDVTAALERDSRQLTSILHFACHCHSLTDLENEFELVLATTEGDEVTLSLKDLRIGFPRQDSGWHGALPLVVLNACASGQVGYRSSSSLPKWFLANGFCGVICTHAEVDDEVAGAFCPFLYDALRNSQTLGAAVVYARRALLEAHSNPLGLMYSYFGSPNLKLVAPRP